MEISERCIVGTAVKYKAQKVLQSLSEDRMEHLPWFAVTTGLGQEELFYIISGCELQYKFYKTDKIRVLGLAASKEEAMSLVTKIVQGALDQNRIFDLKQYAMDY